MNRLEKIFFSTRTMAVLLLLYAIAMAVATFVENDYDTPTAKMLIYESKWFEVLMLWLIILFLANIKRYRLYIREKWPLLIFHLAFVFIFIGGGLTRYVSFEGSMPIPEGDVTNEIISDQTYFKLMADKDGAGRLAYETPYTMSFFNTADTRFPFKREFKSKYQYEDKIITLRSLDYIPRAKDTLAITPDGKKLLELVSVGAGGRESTFVGEGEVKSIGGLLVGFNREMDGIVQIFEHNGELLIKSPFEGEYMQMQGQNIGEVRDSALLAENSGKIPFNSLQKATIRTMYTINGAQFVIPNIPINGKMQYYTVDKSHPEAKELPGVVTLEVSVGDEKDTIEVIGARGTTNFSKDLKLGGLNLSVGFGSVIINTPFSIRLDQFKLTRYPGSMNPSSFESYISVIDDGKDEQHHIYMNNVMDYKGYRFFQASYFPNEQGTVLSVNQDWWGTNITYLGYFLLFTGMFLTLFWKGTRFWQLNNLLVKLHKPKNNNAKEISKINKLKSVLILFMLSGLSMAQHGTIDTLNQSLPEPKSQSHSFDIKMSDPDSLVAGINIDKAHAEKFGALLIQDIEGRIKPIDTHALDIMRKIYKKSNFHGMNANQWFLAIQIDPPRWFNAPIISVGKKGGSELRRLTNANEDGYTSMMNLIDLQTTRYKLDELYNKSFSKKSSERSEFDNEVIAVTERFNILDQAAKGYLTRIIPIQNEPNNTWTSWIYATENSPVEIDTLAYSYMSVYYDAVVKGNNTNDWESANKALDFIGEYQQKWGKDVVPSATKVKTEIFYNKAGIFFWVMIAYTILAGILLILSFLNLFKDNKFTRYLTSFFLGILFLVFLCHAAGLALRWYISGHAPWSNGYEAIVFISWVAVLAGGLLYKNRNAFIPAVGAAVAVIMMGFAHGGSLLDPQITPLVPVLKSYWLMVHVGIITSSYGFFGLGGILSVMSLLLMFFKPTPKINKSLKEMTYVSEMALIIGLFTLTIGTFLGGMWANESWGRYWSWDPKETWAFISVIVYAFVLHMRLVPGLRGYWAYHVASMWSLSSIIMTYIGVNYYLSGLHSYAAGDPIPIPAWIPITAVSALVLSVSTYFFYKKNYSKKKKK